MAELPELETIRRALEKESVGKRLKAPEVLSAKVVKHNGGKKAFQSRLEGAKVKSVDRKGRHLVGNLDNGELLVLDLGSSGYLEKATPKSTAPKGTAVVFAFTQGGQVRLVDPAGDAQAMVVAAGQLGEEVPATAAGGLDPVADAVSWTAFARLVLARSTKLKALLMDPEVVAGIGPIYSDEILYEAGLRHDRIASELSSQEIRRLFRALVETLHEAVKHRGTSLDDAPFADLYGKPGDYQDQLKVYGREGEPCRRCRAPIVKARFANKPVYLCEACQV
ncbi:MAG: bifunctional DNA-formamidopyrimidine glycosylase/DNA-(apurinic or apyrimidinic site) lyase [Acidimicrobiia bacterium]|jgi:formamidopyrimidine-DNA glycosylase